MSPWTDTDTDTDTAATRRAAIQAVLDESRRVLAELRDTLDVLDDIPLDHDSVVAGLRRLLTNVERPPVPRSWHIADVTRQPGIVDLTRGEWPHVCAERWYVTSGGVERRYTCTRIANHTGRHAGGCLGVIFAVWEQTVPEVLGAVEGAA